MTGRAGGDRLDWDDYRLVVRLARAGGAAAAARLLNLSPKTVDARLLALESRLGVKLFEGPPRRLYPTVEGKRVIDAARLLETRARQFETAAGEERDGVGGSVTVYCSEVLAWEVAAEVMANLRQRHRRLRIDLAATEMAADIRTISADIMLAPYAPMDASEWVFRDLPPCRVGLFAHRAYLEAHGVPSSMADLSGHSLIGADSAQRSELSFSLLQRFAQPEVRLRTDHHGVLFEWLLAGLGIGQCHLPLAARHPELARVLPQVEVSLPIYLGCRRWLLGVRRTQEVLDALDLGVRAYLAGDRR